MRNDQLGRGRELSVILLRHSGHPQRTPYVRTPALARGRSAFIAAWVPPVHRMVFDGWVSVGRHGWATGADLICYEHTSGALRESNWSVPRLLSTRGRRGATVIPISTE